MSAYRILVVEDNEQNLKLMRDVLQFSGYEVIEARTGEDGVLLARQRRPHLVLMDLHLPGIDGTEALRLIREDPATRAIPVVAVTASVMKEDRARVYAAGFDGCIEKPISVRALPEQMLDFLSRREASL
jgi:two-component system cell cycle response regulator DivK